MPALPRLRHTLLLLDATGAYHREITRQITDKGMHVTTPMMRLQAEKQTKILLVTLGKPRRYWKLPASRQTCGVQASSLGHGLSISALPQPIQFRLCYASERLTN